MLKTFKTVLYTLMACVIFTFASALWWKYEQSAVDAKEIETQKIVDTLAEITTYKKPNFERANNQTFINSVGECVAYIYNTTTDVYPVNLEVLLAQAALESGWGNSRFALEGKNLFGIRTYDLSEPHMQIQGTNKSKKWGVKVYQHECDSVQHYIDILNNGSAYEEYRKLRDNGVVDSLQYVNTLGAYASDKKYFPKVKRIIKKLREDYDLPIIK
tara:strand:- start:843 stop:1487 length:645 start_codon:yes stop_codon:yes gene_type:complete